MNELVHNNNHRSYSVTPRVQSRFCFIINASIRCVAKRYLVVDFLEVIVQVNFAGVLLATAITDVLLETLVNHFHVTTPAKVQQLFEKPVNNVGTRILGFIHMASMISVPQLCH
jgi:hypothetical protein